MGYGFEFKCGEIADLQVKNFQVIDLTKMFGSDDGIVSALGLTSASDITGEKINKAFHLIFPGSYYAYDAGSLLSFNPSDIETVGFNQYDNSKQTANVHVLADNKYRIKGTYSGLTYSDGTNVTVTDGYFTPDRVDYLTLAGGNDVDTCVHLSWSGWRDPDEDYEAYWKSDTDLSWIREIEYNGGPLFPNGLNGIGDVYDEVTEKYAIKRVGTVDLGTLRWVYRDAISSHPFGCDGQVLYKLRENIPMVCPKYEYKGVVANGGNVNGNMTLWCFRTSEGEYSNVRYIYLLNNNYNASSIDNNGHASFLEGVVLYYELETPIIVNFDEPKVINYKMDDFGTEQLVNLDAAVNTPGLCKPTLVEVGYQSNLRDKIRRLDDNYVSFTVDQTSTKTDAEKAQARRNIDTVDKDGTYPQMHVGLADNIVSPDGKIDTDNFVFRTTAGSADVSSGYATLEKLEGNTVVWNQKVISNYKSGSNSAVDTRNNETAKVRFRNRTDSSIITEFYITSPQRKVFIATIPSNCTQVDLIRNGQSNLFSMIPSLGVISSHKYYIVVDFKTLDYQTVGGYTWDNVQAIDLTLLGIANLATVEDVEEWLEKNVGHKEYYPYDAGSLLSVDVSGLKTVGFNLFNPAVGKASLPGSTGTEDLTNGTYCYQITGAYTTIADVDGNAITPDTNGYFNVTKPQEITVNGGDTTTCVHLTWSGYRNGEYEPYWTETLNLEFIKSLEYTQTGSETPEKLFQNGLCSAGNVHDEVTATKAIKRIGVVDLGTLNWTLNPHPTYGNVFSVVVTNKAEATINMLNVKYEVSSPVGWAVEEKHVCSVGGNSNIYVKDSSYTDVATFKAAMSGIILYYELAEPIEVDITPEQNLNYRMDDFGMEEFVSNSESIPQTTSPYSTIKYMDNLRDKLRNIDKNFVGYDEQIVSEEKKSVARGNIGAAATSGAYPELLAGNLVGQTVDNDTYLIRPTGNGGEDVASGTARVISMEGNSCVWRQLVPLDKKSGTQTGYMVDLCVINYTEEAHKFYLIGNISSSASNIPLRLICTNTSGQYTERTLVSAISNEPHTYRVVTGFAKGYQGKMYIRAFLNSSTTSTIVWNDLAFIDLTLLGIDNLTTTAQVEAWLAQNVGTKPCYTYNAGTILSAQTLGIKTYGQNLLNPETKKATLIPYSWEVNSNIYTIKNIPSGATATFTPDKTSVAETVDVSSGSLDITSYGSGVLELSDATANTYVCMKWDGTKDNDVVPYENHTYNFDVRKVYGKVNGEGSYVQCFPNGMNRIDTYRDTLTASRAVVRVGVDDLGNFNWSKLTFSTSNLIGFRTDISNARRVPNNTKNFLTATKQYSATDATLAGISDGYYLNINQYHDGYNRISIVDKDYSSHTAAQFQTDVTGTKLYYQYASPITYTNLIYSEDEGATGTPIADVLMNITVNNWSMEEQLLPAYVDGNPTSVTATVSTIYGLNAVEAIAKLQKTTYTESEVHSNLASLISCINTNCSTVLGGTFNISDTATEKVFSFTFTPNE